MTTVRRSFCWAFAMLVAALADGCSPQSSATATTIANSSVESAEAKGHNLTIYGYNYTDTGIGSFEVNGQGGGNLEVSDTTAGGGKSTCCTTVYTPFRTSLRVRIKWTRDLKTWCDTEVLLEPPLPSKPEYFEVHFYRDGHIEVNITETESSPRLQLERDSRGSRHRDTKRNINNDDKFGSCKVGYL